MILNEFGSGTNSTVTTTFTKTINSTITQTTTKTTTIQSADSFLLPVTLVILFAVAALLIAIYKRKKK